MSMVISWESFLLSKFVMLFMRLLGWFLCLVISSSSNNFCFSVCGSTFSIV